MPPDSQGKTTMSHSIIRLTAHITVASRGLESGIALEEATSGVNAVVNYFSNAETAGRLYERIQKDGGCVEWMERRRPILDA